MAKKTKTNNIDQRKLFVIIMLLVAFSAGFLVARARYKPQIKSTFEMVMERENAIDDLKSKVEEYKEQLEEDRREF